MLLSSFSPLMTPKTKLFPRLLDHPSKYEPSSLCTRGVSNSSQNVHGVATPFLCSTNHQSVTLTISIDVHEVSTPSSSPVNYPLVLLTRLDLVVRPRRAPQFNLRFSPTAPRVAVSKWLRDLFRGARLPHLFVWHRFVQPGQ